VPVRRLHTQRRSMERRRTTWARSVGTLSNASAATSITSDLLAQFKTGGGTVFGCTVARIHLRLNALTAVAASDNFAVGVIKGQDTDVGATIAGAPTPITHPYEDWLWWSSFYADTNGHFFPGGGNVYEVDIKAKRKLSELNENLNIVAVSTNATAFPQQVDYSASVLLMLP